MFGRKCCAMRRLVYAYLFAFAGRGVAFYAPRST